MNFIVAALTACALGADHDRLVLLGANMGGTWEWDGATWKRLVGAAIPATDTIALRASPARPVLDGQVSEREYGSPTVRLPTATGEVRVWLVRHDGYVYIGAEMPDSSFYWGDDLVVSLDANGSAEANPQPGDRQWYLRRTLDSSVVFAAVRGGWNTPGQMPPMLGPTRSDGEWDVAAVSTATGWSLELRIRERVLDGVRALPRIAFRTYNNAPHGWWSWPAPPPGTPPQRVERNPQLWTPLTIAP